MRRCLAISTVFLFALPLTTLTAVAGGDKKAEGPSAARELRVKVRVKADGKPTEPRRIKSKEKLESVITDPDSRMAVLKEIDFDKESLVVFAWQGSGQDRITASGDAAAVKFTYVAGFTRDLRQHVKLFAIPKDAKISVLKGGR